MLQLSTLPLRALSSPQTAVLPCRLPLVLSASTQLLSQCLPRLIPRRCRLSMHDSQVFFRRLSRSLQHSSFRSPTSIKSPPCDCSALLRPLMLTAEAQLESRAALPLSHLKPPSMLYDRILGQDRPRHGHEMPLGQDPLRREPNLHRALDQLDRPPYILPRREPPHPH